MTATQKKSEEYCGGVRRQRGLAPLSVPILLLTLVVLGEATPLQPKEFRKLFGNNTTIVSGEVVAGGTARLPCDVASPGLDKLALVVWYKDGRVSPLYSYDVRGRKPLAGSHWAEREVLGARAYFRVGLGPGAAALELDNVVPSDSGLYRCRTDYNKLPTRNHVVNLTVIVPVERLALLDQKHGQHIRNYQLGPYNEGDTVSITCLATGGQPPPQVTWWAEGELLPSRSRRLPGRAVESILTLEPLSRRHLDTVFTCKANNSELAPTISSDLKLTIHLRPLWVRLRGRNRPLSAGISHDIECEVVGALPAPAVSWWKGSLDVTSPNSTIHVSSDGNVTVSVLRFTPHVSDSGKLLSCRGQQSSMIDGGLEDSWKLVIHHAPIVWLELGSSANSSAIREGADVYFECNIKANPWIYQIRWIYDGEQLYSEADGGVLVSNQSLVLRAVSRARSGSYSCLASNNQGDGESNTVLLDILYAPVCRPGQVSSYGVGIGETIRVSCEVEANPPPASYIWRHNTTGDIPSNKVIVEGLRSLALYRGRSEPEYGFLLCWARNDVGGQLIPCVFHLVPADKPDSLQNCSVRNVTAHSLNVECVAGGDGGLAQQFGLRVRTGAQPSNLLTAPVPRFTALGLRPGQLYRLEAFAFNSKGEGPPSAMEASTLRSAEERTEYLRVWGRVPVWGGLCAGGGAALLLALVSTVVCVRRARRASQARTHTPSHEDLNPDAVLPGGETEEWEEERAFAHLRSSTPTARAHRYPATHTPAQLYTNHHTKAAAAAALCTLPRRAPPANPAQPLLYAQLQLQTFTPADCRRSKAGIAESDRLAQFTEQQSRFQMPPSYCPSDRF